MNTTQQLPEITLKQIIAYCDREHQMQLNVYGPKVKAGKMSRDTANEYYRIISQYRSLCMDAANRGLKWEQIRGIVQEYPLIAGISENQETSKK